MRNLVTTMRSSTPAEAKVTARPATTSGAGVMTADRMPMRTWQLHAPLQGPPAGVRPHQLPPEQRAPTWMKTLKMMREAPEVPATQINKRITLEELYLLQAPTY